MKKIVLVATLLIIAVLGATFLFKSTPDTLVGSKPDHLPESQDILPSPTPRLIQGYVVHAQLIHPQALILIPNASPKKTSSEIMEANTCRYGTNGGYYMTNGKPLGLFVIDGKEYSPFAISSAANAFLVKTQEGTLSIVHEAPPIEDTAFILQAGPYLKTTIKPSILNDEHARRVLIARTESDEWYFVAITDPENAYLGPLLSEVPEILSKLPQKFTEALNLDGGTASAFYSEEGIKFGELTPIGSFLCEK